MRRLPPLLALFPLVALLAVCGDEQTLTLAPPTFSEVASTGTVSGDVLGPDDSSICDHIPGASTVRVDVIDPVHATQESPLAASQSLICPANSFSIPVAAGTYRLRTQLPADPGIEPLPWRWLEPGDVVVSDGTAVKDITVLHGISLEGTAKRGPYWAPPVILRLLYDFPAAANFVAAYGLSDGLDGTWNDRATGGSQLLVQGGVDYRAGCPVPWPGAPLDPNDVGFRLLVGAPADPFLFPSDVNAINCWYEDGRTDVPGLGVDANNYQLVLRPSGILGTGFFRDGEAANAIMFGGGVAYTGSQPRYTFSSYDPSGRTSGNMLGLPVEVMEPGPFADHQTRTVLRERPWDSYWQAHPMGLLVVRETFAWSTPPNDDYIIFKYTLFNPNDWRIADLTAGQVLDHDLTDLTWHYARQNYVEFPAVPGDFYVVLVEEPWMGLWAGHALLGDTPIQTYSYRSWDESGDSWFTDPAELSTWHEYLTGGVPQVGPHGPGNVRHLLSPGPVTLPLHSSAFFVTVLAGGRGRKDALNNLYAAREKWVLLPSLVRDEPARIHYARVTVDRIKPGDTKVEVRFVFEHPDVANKFDKNQTFCSGAVVDEVLRQKGSMVLAEFSRSLLDPWIISGDPLVCVGRLSNGRLFGGADIARVP